MIVLPRLYAILDAGFFSNASSMLATAEELAAAGCTLIQYRNKSGNARVMLEQARALRQLFPRAHVSKRQRDMKISDSTIAWGAPGLAEFARPGNSVTLIMNDRADLCVAAEFDGLHVGQDDLSPEYVRTIIGPERWLGVSTHNPEQLREADLTSADYLAIGPVFATTSKARSLTRKPLVAIGGITRANAASVIQAGADSVAVISDLQKDPRKSAEEFFRILG